MKLHVYVQTKFVPRISPKKENYIVTWPYLAETKFPHKKPQPPITFLMVHPLLTLKPQTNTRKYQLKHSFIITFIVSVLRILNMTYNVFGKRYKPIHFFIHSIFAWYKNIFETKTKIQMICFLPHCFFGSLARVSFNHVTGLQSFLKESQLFFSGACRIFLFFCWC